MCPVVVEQGNPHILDLEASYGAEPEVCKVPKRDAIEPEGQSPIRNRTCGGRCPHCDQFLDAVPLVCLDCGEYRCWAVLGLLAIAPTVIVHTGERVSEATSLSAAVLIHASVVAVGVGFSRAFLVLGIELREIGPVWLHSRGPQEAPVSCGHASTMIRGIEVETGFVFEIPSQVETIVGTRQHLNEIARARLSCRHPQTNYFVRCIVGGPQIHNHKIF